MQYGVCVFAIVEYSELVGTVVTVVRMHAWAVEGWNALL